MDLYKDQIYGKWMYTVKIEYNKAKYLGGNIYREIYSPFHWSLYLESICQTKTDIKGGSG